MLRLFVPLQLVAYWLCCWNTPMYQLLASELVQL